MIPNNLGVDYRWNKLALDSQLLKMSDEHRGVQFPILSAFCTCLKCFIFNSFKNKTTLAAVWRLSGVLLGRWEDREQRKQENTLGGS